MGVENFWQLIESTGRPVNMSRALEGKVLAIDVSIWLHQAAKGMRDRQNPHILLLLHRICKLFHFKIKPIFVFDGEVPDLKRKTLAERRKRRENVEKKIEESNEKIRRNNLKMIALQQLRGEILPENPSQQHEKDLFELPDDHLKNQFFDDENQNLDEFDSNFQHQQSETFILPEENEIDDETLNNLPKQMQFDILTGIKEKMKRRQKGFEDLPKKGDEFSNYQVQRLLKQNSVTKRILNLNTTIKRQKLDLEVDPEASVFSGKLSSDVNTQFVLIKNQTKPLEKPREAEPVVVRRTMNFSAEAIWSRDPVTGLQLTSTEKSRDDLFVNETKRENQEKISENFQTQIEAKPLETFSAPNKSKTRGKNLETFSVAQQSTFDETSDEETDLREVSTQIEPKIHEKTFETSTIRKEIFSAERPSNEEKSPIAESTDSESDESDFVEVEISPKPSEVVLLAPFLNPPEEPESEEELEDLPDFVDENPSSRDTSTKPEKKDWDQIRNDLVEENRVEKEKIDENRPATLTLNDSMHEETKFLLRLFGIPFVVSPGEAEAQCAYLNATGQCDGVITDDSDVWLFGGRQIYKNFFRQNQNVEFYDGNFIEKQLGLDRETMISIGMIVGSDYTNGIPKAGIVTAIEILQQFHGNCLERLEKFRNFCEENKKNPEKNLSKILRRLKNLQIPDAFPSRLVYEAYRKPKVDESREKFSWGTAQLELLREFLGEKLKWNREKIDEILLPAIKRRNEKEIQSRIESFFSPSPFEATSSKTRRNARIIPALELLKRRQEKGKDRPSSDDEENSTKKTFKKRSKSSNSTRNFSENEDEQF